MTTIARPSDVPDVRPADPFRERIGDYIQVRSGGPFWPFDPRPEDIHALTIGTIAHALARINRYTGHTKGDFGLSVAQHSVTVSLAVPPEYALAGLLHDAAEAVMGDVPRPVKNMPQMAFYREAEARLLGLILGRFGLPDVLPRCVKVADDRALAAEVRDLMTPDPRIWGKWLDEIEPLPETVAPWWPGVAEAVFLDRYEEITGKSRSE